MENKKQTNSKTKPYISTELTHAQRLKVQKIISVHCKKVRWVTGNQVNHRDFPAITKDIVMIFNPRNSTILLSLCLARTVSLYPQRLVTPKSFLVALKQHCGDDLAINKSKPTTKTPAKLTKGKVSRENDGDNKRKVKRNKRSIGCDKTESLF